MEQPTTPTDPVLAAYLHGVDRTLWRENLKLTPAQRLEKLVRFTAFASKLQHAGAESRAKAPRNQAR